MAVLKTSKYWIHVPWDGIENEVGPYYVILEGLQTKKGV
jgi:hypothetical protein